MNFTLSAKERIKSRDEVRMLFRSGKQVKAYPIRLVYHQTPSSDNPGVRVLFSVPKRLHKKAVDRNRIKRKLREIYRLNKHLIEGDADEEVLIAVVYQASEIREFNDLSDRLILSLQQLNKRLKQSN